MIDGVSSAAMDLSHEWGRRADNLGDRINPELVHKADLENVLVSRLERVAGDTEDEFITAYHIDPKQAFFFEHNVNHVPGLMLVEASRQAAEAISQLYFDVPSDSGFILSELNCKFSRFADLTEPLFSVTRVQNTVRHGGAVVRLRASSTMIQHDSTVAELSGMWRILTRRIYERVAAMSPAAPAQVTGTGTGTGTGQQPNGHAPGSSK